MFCTFQNCSVSAVAAFISRICPSMLIFVIQIWLWKLLKLIILLWKCWKVVACLPSSVDKALLFPQREVTVVTGQSPKSPGDRWDVVGFPRKVFPFQKWAEGTIAGHRWWFQKVCADQGDGENSCSLPSWWIISWLFFAQERKTREVHEWSLCWRSSLSGSATKNKSRRELQTEPGNAARRERISAVLSVGVLFILYFFGGGLFGAALERWHGRQLSLRPGGRSREDGAGVRWEPPSQPEVWAQSGRTGSHTHPEPQGHATHSVP